MLWVRDMIVRKLGQVQPAANRKRVSVRSRSAPLPLHAVRPSERELAEIVRISWCRETSYNAAQWSRSNPGLGQCAVTALIVQDFLGGKLLRGKICGEDHYWNFLPGQGELDLTRQQFKEATVNCAPSDVQREYVLSYPDTKRRYEHLLALVQTRLRKLKPQSTQTPAWGPSEQTRAASAAHKGFFKP